jgi:hypothetical protein
MHQLLAPTVPFRTGIGTPARHPFALPIDRSRLWWPEWPHTRHSGTAPTRGAYPLMPLMTMPRTK